LWELHNAIEQPDPEAERAGEQAQILAFKSAQAESAKADQDQVKRRRAA
jgi:hypothetical protein